MENEILIALIAKMIDDRLSQIPVTSGPRGARGIPGRDGLDFVFSEHEGAIREWAKEFALKFEDLSNAQIENLRGARGRDGRDGSDGRDFCYTEHRDAIESIIRGTVSDLRGELKLQFSDLTQEEIGTLRGPRGRDGKDGKGFSFDEHRNEIESSLQRTVDENRDGLRLKLGDLTVDELAEIRGPRGRDGRDGRDFDFDEHLDFFNSLRLKFSDLTDEEKQTLKLQFSHLTEDEKNSLKLKFSDLTEEDHATLKGPRGLRGQRGSQGRDGQAGPRGPRGTPGPVGIRGITGVNGVDGRDGIDGLNAPYITSIDIRQLDDEIIFRFTFSDGSVLDADPVQLPRPQVSFSGGRGGTGKMNYDTRIDEPDSATMYVGETTPGNGANTAEAVWRIKKVLESGSETTIEFAGGKAEFNYVWDDRAVLTYG